MAVLERTNKKEERAPQIWPVSVKAYHALGELGLIPENSIFEG
jgi:hypothetical protein